MIAPCMKELQVRDMALMQLAKGHLLGAMMLPKDAPDGMSGENEAARSRSKSDSKRRQEQGAEDEDGIVYLAKSMEDIYRRR